MADGRMRRYLNQEVNPWPILIGVGATVVVLALFASAGRGGVGLLVVIGTGVLWSGFERLRPGRVVEMHEVERFSADCGRVWSVIKPADTAPLLYPSIRRGFRVPGTPDGVGEQQAFELESGAMIVVEVIELIPGRRAVVRMVSPPTDVPTTTSFELTPVDDGCLFRQQIELTLPRGKRLGPGYAQTWRAETTEMFGRVRALLDHSPVPPTPWPPTAP